METYQPRRSLADRVVLITGASRGIGREVAVRAAADGATVALLAKTLEPNPKISGTLDETAAAVRAAGGTPLANACDVRDPVAVGAAVSTIIDAAGGIDVVVNNAGALDLRSTEALPPEAFARLLAVNVAGPFAVVQAALPYLRASSNAHIVNISPPLNLHPGWVGAHVGHTVGKYSESLLTLGWAAEFAAVPIAVNSLWPATTVASTGMVAALGEQQVTAQARTPKIMADAAHALVTRLSSEVTGRFLTDEEVLVGEGVTDFSSYRLAAEEADLVPNFYLAHVTPPEVGLR